MMRRHRKKIDPIITLRKLSLESKKIGMNVIHWRWLLEEVESRSAVLVEMVFGTVREGEYLTLLARQQRMVYIKVGDRCRRYHSLSIRLVRYITSNTKKSQKWHSR